jgi:hypothetical protein
MRWTGNCLPFSYVLELKLAGHSVASLKVVMHGDDKEMSEHVTRQ